MASSAISLNKKTVVWFNDVGKEDIPVAGGKGANLGEMTRAGIPVPPGFIVTSQAYFEFLAKTKLSNKIKKLLSTTNVHDSGSLNKSAAKIKEIIVEAKMPDETADAIRRCYAELGEGYVAVRSSATAEDLPEASFAGQQSTFLNVNGTENVVKAVQGCWASLFEARAIFYRENQKFDHMKVGIAVPVQRMVQSEKSGVMFTIDPNNGNTNRIIIEAAYGLGEAVVSGSITPDLYVVDKEKRIILERRVNKQDWLLTRNTSSNGHSKGNMQMEIPPAKQVEQKLTDDEIMELSEIGVRLEGHYHAPQDVEWAREGGNFYLVQARPLTAISTQVGMESDEISKLASRVLLTGTGAGPGMASGPVKIVLDLAELDRVLPGDILVT
ncbi:MAG: phosphoenolpyruvate synthase, partial [Dehalococcoidia bacterium]|nr:phosphoenolpyruvate synthase [Dehalococcoidia bacterium]